MLKRSFKFGAWLTGLTVLCFVVLGAVTNVPTRVTDSDVAVFRDQLHLAQPTVSLTYEQQIQLIKSVQYVVLDKAPVGKPIPDNAPREPADLFRNKSGWCYDRSRTFDKVFSWLGFRTRHLFILYSKDPRSHSELSFWKAVMTPGTESHAVTEVLTSRGWIVVDSNSAWISQASDGSPVDADHISTGRLHGSQPYRTVLIVRSGPSVACTHGAASCMHPTPSLFRISIGAIS